MSKKFLTIFALVALLVAAMAGAAFAATTIATAAVEAIVLSGDANGTNIGGVVKATDATNISTASFTTNAYYLGDADELNVKIGVSLDVLTVGEDALASALLSAEVEPTYSMTNAINPTPLASTTADAYVLGSMDLTITSWDSIPETILINKIGLWGGALGSEALIVAGSSKSADLKITTVPVVFEVDEPAIDIDVASEDEGIIVTLDLNEYVPDDYGLMMVSTDGKTLVAVPAAINSSDAGSFTVTLTDKDAGEITISTSKTGPGAKDAEFEFVIVASDDITVLDGGALVAGVNKTTPASNDLVHFTVTVVDGANPDDPTAGMFEFDPANKSEYEVGYRFDLPVKVTPTSPEVLGAVTALNVAVLSDNAEGALTKAIEVLNATSKDHFIISGDATVEGTLVISMDVTTTSGEVETVTSPVRYEVVITPAGGGDDEPVVEPVNMLNTAALEELAKLEAKLIDVDVLKEMLEAGTATIDPTETFADLDTNNYYKAFPSANIEIPLSGLDGANAVPLTLTVNSTYGGFVFNEANLTKSADVFYEYVPGKSDGKTTPDPDRVISNWSEAFAKDVATVDASGNLHINYVVIDADYKAPYIAGNCLFIFDADYDSWIMDPLWVAERKTSKSTSDDGGSVGCDAGLGAFALLGLAGMAVILRKKD